jgi:hypothetical protein
MRISSLLNSWFNSNPSGWVMATKECAPPVLRRTGTRSVASPTQDAALRAASRWYVVAWPQWPDAFRYYSRLRVGKAIPFNAGSTSWVFTHKEPPKVLIFNFWVAANVNGC